MAFLGMILFGIGLILALIGGLWIVVIAFKESVIWGLGSLLIPLVALIFVAQHWAAAKKPFIVEVVGIGLIILAQALGGGGN
jgi:hypothetical protein